jgi:branched-chain amino acid transport system permease protein
MNKREILTEIIILILLILIGIIVPKYIPQQSIIQEIFRKIPQMFIMAIAAIGLNIILGYAGMFHFGIGAFVAIGAYTIGILTYRNYPFGLDFWQLFIIAPLVTMVIGILLGLPLMRLKGDYLAIVTLGFAEIVKDTLVNVEVITKGTQGLDPIPAPSFPSSWNISFTESDQPWYFFTLIILFICLRVCKNITSSNYGRLWKSIRDDEIAASCMGINPVSVKLRALAIGCFFAGLAGMLYASNLGTTVEPKNYDFNFSAMLIVMVILGGLGNVYGSILGVIILQGFDSLCAILSERIQRAAPSLIEQTIFLDPKNWKWLVFGLLLIIVVRFKPKGLLPEK